MNGYGDAGKIGQFIGAFTGELKEKSSVSIVYDAEKKATTVKVARRRQRDGRRARTS